MCLIETLIEEVVKISSIAAKKLLGFDRAQYV